MLFDNTTPERNYIVPRTTSNNPWLGVMGYNDNGTRNTWGDISSWIPGVNIAQNAIAQGMTQGTDSNASVQGDMKNRIDKMMMEAAVAATVATAGAAAPAAGTLGATALQIGVPMIQGAGKEAAGNLLSGKDQNQKNMYVPQQFNLTNYNE